MKAIVIGKFGGPEVLEYREVPAPAMDARQILVRQKAIGVNFIDIYRRTGLYPVTFPHIPGSEGAGIVEALGADARGISIGDRVVYTDARGAYSESVAVPADRAVRIPKGIDFEQAAAAMLQGMTAHYLALDTYSIKKGDTVLIHAAAGGVGLLLVQVARMRGARVIATVSTPEKAELARGAGAHEVILYGQEDFVAAVKRITGGKGVQAVYDSVGKDTFMKSLDCLAPRGTLIAFGQSSGKVEAIEPGILSAKGSLYLTRPTIGNYTAEATELERRAADIFKWISKGDLNVRIGTRLPLEQAAEAHRMLEARETSGKVLLIPG
jgi:NADPH2:quinone reductase